MAENTIDTLVLEVSSDMSKASGGLTRLANSMEKLARNINGIQASKFNDISNGLNGIAKISFNTKPLTDLFNSITKLGTKSATAATENIPQLTEVIGQLVSKMNEIKTLDFDTGGLAELVSSISKLGGKGATNAIPNIDSLSNALKKMMETLSDAPAVSQNVIDMTNAMASLSRNGANVSGATKSITKGIDSYSKNVNKAKKSTKSLTSSIAKLYAGYFTLSRGIKAIVNSVKSASDYVETLNYFNASFEQVASKADVDSWEKYGYESAEAYANSFQQRAKELSKKLTGFEISDSGDLTRTTGASLGLDPDKTLQYQSMFAQMASSMGTTSEQALKLSNALTMIGADLASVRNLDFEDVWKDMASGMVGMSRTLDKYGTNIRNTNLQQELYNLGIETSISKLGQQDKAILRTIVLLNSTQYAWGDLANTISQPANQMRLLQANFTSLGRTIGSLFLPIVAKILPYINAIVIALQRLFSWIGKLLGIKISDFSSSIGGSAIDMGELADESDDAAGGIDDAAASAKQLEKTLSVLPFDELNQLADTKTASVDVDAGTSGSMPELNAALDDAISKYKIAWDKAFSEMENRANELADKIVNVFKKTSKTVRDFSKIFKSGFYNGLGDYKPILNELGKDFESIGESLYSIFTDPEIRSAISDYTKSWVKSIGEIAGSVFSVGLTIAQNLIGGIEIYFSENSERIKQWLVSIFDVDKQIVELIAKFATDFADVFSVFGSETAQQITANILTIFSETFMGITEFLQGIILTIVEKIVEIFNENKETIKEALSGTLEGLEAVTNVIKNTVQFISQTVLPDLNKGIKGVIDVIDPFIDFLVGAFLSAWNDILNPALQYLGKTILPDLLNVFKKLWNEILVPLGTFIGSVFSPVIDFLSRILTSLWKNIIVPLAKAIGGVFGKAWENLMSILGRVMDSIGQVIDVLQFFWDKVGKPVANWLVNTFAPIFDRIFKGIGTMITGLKKSLGGILDFIGGVFTGDWRKAWQGIKDTFAGIWEGFSFIVKSPINAIIGILNALIRGVAKVANWIGEILNSLSFEIPDWVPIVGGKKIGFDFGTWTPGQIPYLYNGGVLKKGQVALLEGSGAEAVVPLENNKKWISAVASEMKSDLSGYKISDIPVYNDFDYSERKISGIVGSASNSDMDSFADRIVSGVTMAIMNNRQDINLNCYAELKMENDETLARAVARGQQKLDYRNNAVPKYGY